ncbi:MAG: hydrolase [Anaerolineae bacterium]|nr:hydrolase [Anaerolineae bacterium]
MLSRDNTLLVLVDVQGKLAQIMHDREALFRNLVQLVRGVRVLGLPIIWMEQNPRGLGPTIPELAELLPDLEPIPKLSFSCCGSPEFHRALKAHDRRQVLIAGIETHVCIYQTTLDLLSLGYEVQVVGDAVSSRRAVNREIALERVRQAGAAVTSVEMALFEILRVAEGPAFKAMLQVVR